MRPARRRETARKKSLSRLFAFIRAFSRAGLS
jgi:hypothetical protein